MTTARDKIAMMLCSVHGAGCDCAHTRLFPQPETDEVPRAQHEALMAALFSCAAHCQGGHSEAGAAAAKALDIPFPITMFDLKRKAISAGFDPDKLWPWLSRMDRAAGIDLEDKT